MVQTMLHHDSSLDAGITYGRLDMNGNSSWPEDGSVKLRISGQPAQLQVIKKSDDQLVMQSNVEKDMVSIK
jgi:hypothetical protein